MNVEQLVGQLPIGQKRTSKVKPYVFLAGSYIEPNVFQCGQCVYKGPYPKCKVTNALERYRNFKKLSLPMVVCATGSIEGEDGIYLIFPNLMAGLNIQVEDHYDLFIKRKVKVMMFSPIQPLNRYPDLIPRDPDIACTLLYVLVVCYILGVGDINLRNILVDVRTGHLFVIDFDDNRTNGVIDHPLFYFTKYPHDKINWYNRMGYHYSHIVSWLEYLRPHFINCKLLDQSITMLKKYSIDRVEVAQTGSLGKMKRLGVTSGLTFSGWTHEQCKHQLLDALAQANLHDALICAVELYRLQDIGCDIIVSNMYNRLLYYAIEKHQNIPLILSIAKLVENRDRDVYTLAAIVDHLISEQKTPIIYKTSEIVAEEPLPKESYMLEDRPDDLILMKHWRQQITTAQVDNLTDFLEQYGKNQSVVPKRLKIVGARGSTSNRWILLWHAIRDLLDPAVYKILMLTAFMQRDFIPFLKLAATVIMIDSPIEPLNLTPTIQRYRDSPLISNLLKGVYS